MCDGSIIDTAMLSHLIDAAILVARKDQVERDCRAMDAAEEGDDPSSAFRPGCNLILNQFAADFPQTRKENDGE